MAQLGCRVAHDWTHSHRNNGLSGEGCAFRLVDAPPARRNAKRTRGSDTLHPLAAEDRRLSLPSPRVGRFSAYVPRERWETKTRRTSNNGSSNGPSGLAATSGNACVRHRVAGVPSAHVRGSAGITVLVEHRPPLAYFFRVREGAKAHWRTWLWSTCLEFPTASFWVHVLRFHVQLGP